MFSKKLFADDSIDHTPQPGTTPDKAGVRKLYSYIRAAFPDFHAEIHWQLADGDRVTTYKTYYGTHEGHFLGVAPTHRKIHFETVDVMHVQKGKITDHWGSAIFCRLCSRSVGGFRRQKHPEHTPATTPDHEFLVSLTPEAIPWKPVFEGAEMAVVSGDPHQCRLPVCHSRETSRRPTGATALAFV